MTRILVLVMAGLFIPYSAEGGEQRYSTAEVEFYNCDDLRGDWVFRTKGDHPFYVELIRIRPLNPKEKFNGGALVAEVRPWGLRGSEGNWSDALEKLADPKQGPRIELNSAHPLAPADSPPNYCLPESEFSRTFKALPLQKPNNLHVFALTIPVKLRLPPALEGKRPPNFVDSEVVAPAGVTATASVSGLFGVAYERRLVPTKNYAFVFGGAFGVSAEKFTYRLGATDGDATDDVTVVRPAINLALTPGVRLGPIDIFVPFGGDFMLGPDRFVWSEQGKFWIGLGIGVGGIFKEGARLQKN